ncbi:MAG: sortase [Candidatus Microsaccharimonas sp.]
MNPDKSSPGGDMPTPSLSGSSIPPNPAPSTQDAAANVIRSQIDQLYNNTSAPDNSREVTPVAQVHEEPVKQAILADTNPYHRTHTPHSTPQADQWKEYHSAWQNYYQKYYENYYTQTAAQAQQPQGSHYFSGSSRQPERIEETAEELSNDQALYELRQKLLGKVQASAKKIRRSRHFVPIAAALGVVLIFVFLQYNRVFIANVAAYVSPGSIDPQNIVVDPSNDIVVSNDPRLIIPKINVDVPVLYDVGTDNASQMAAMEKGVAHFPIPGANSHPGEIGNTAIAGHSSNDLFDQGDYKFIFAQLEKLAPGDSIYANYQGKRYTYVVTKMEVVKPNEIGKLVYPTDKPVLTLITCTPLGTAINRLLVTAEQVSPDPSAAAAAPEGAGQGDDTSAIPGNSPTLFERLFGGGN